MQETPGHDSPPSLLDALLEYACRGLAADHVTFCRYEPAAHTVRIVAWHGALSHPEVTDTEIALPAYGGDAETLSASLRSDEVLVASLDEAVAGADQAMREFLDRVGSHTILFVPVLDIADGIWVLEAFFAGAGRVVGAVEKAEAARLARLAAAAIDRHLLVEQNERLLAETRRAQILHRSLINHVPAITYVHLRDGTPLHISPQIEQVTGIAAADWEVGLVSWPDALHPDDRERADDAYKRFIEEGGSYTDSYRLLHRDGSVHWMDDRAIMLPGENGEQDVVQGVAVEITASKEAERALRDSEARYRSLAENNVAGVWQMEGLNVIYVNPAYCRILGIAPEEAMGRGWERFISEDSRGQLAQQQRSREEGVSATYELGLVRKDGDRRTTIVSAVPLTTEDGTITGAIGTIVDVTELRRAQEALRESEQRRRWVLGELLRAEQEERSRIAAELHDDTVQVMTATLFSLDRVARSVHGDAVVPVTAARDLLAAATERTRRLMFELRPPLLEAGGLEPALSELAGQLRRETGVEVTVRLEVGRHPQPVELLVYRVVQEAVANCRKHAGAQEVLIELREHDEAIHGEIADDGIGFDAEQALDRSRMRLHLGLDAMRERVLLAGGEFRLETSPGQGTAVRFTIPLPRRGLHAVG